MAGPQKNRSRREAERPGGPPSSSNQSSSAQSSASSAKTTSTAAKTVMSAQYDGPKDSAGASTERPKEKIMMKNLEALGLSMWRGHLGVDSKTPLPKRNGKFNSLGREVPVNLNVFNVTQLPTKPVQQYDITIVNDNGTPSRLVLLKVWRSRAMAQVLGNGSWIYDGNKLAWSTAQIKRTDVTVDLSAEEGKKPSPKNTFRVRIDPTKVVSFTLLQAFLDGKTDGGEALLETISFLDHVMRQAPSEKYTQIKKSFFARGEQRFSLGSGVEAFKGVFASCRMALDEQRKPRMVVNVDVANGTFLTQCDLMDSAPQVCRCRNIDDFIAQFAQAKGNWHKSNMYRYLKAYTHVSVFKKHAVASQKGREFKIKKFLNKDAYEHTFKQEKKDNNGNTTSSREVSIAQYFKEAYGLHCKKGLPVVEMTKAGEVVPLEALVLCPNQRFKIKLDDKQTANMIKFAVTLPKDRWSAVQHGLRMLDWNNDPYLRAFGMKISQAPSTVKGRILPTPEPTFGNGKIDARSASQGRWRIDGKKFTTPNSRPLKAWGFAIVDNGRGPCVTLAQAQHFASRFAQIARTHGMRVESEPHILPVKTMRGGEMISDAWNSTGNKYGAKPNILFFVVPDKNSELYRRIKKSCECRYGVVSQVLQSAHVLKAQDQYMSNVCMKVNAKLGGATCFATGVLTRMNPNFGKVPTMIIGADVSHASPGDDSSGSMAAFTMSLDKQFTRFAAVCETNGNRVEIISTSIINNQLKMMVENWAKMYAGHLPHQVLYFRDGVSEGQFDFVIKQEVADMKEMMKSINPKVEPKFTVVICGKRHHVRFFPQGAGADRNGNPQVGTLVESGITHPFEMDYYLASHSAIKGTARPVHYNVIMNENNYDVTFIEQLTFEHCLQYARSTTPVSMVPAVYYAHLASNRATAHKNEPSHSSGKKEANEKAKQAQTLSSSDKTLTEIPPLLALNNSMGILGTMWYI